MTPPNLMPPVDVRDIPSIVSGVPSRQVKRPALICPICAAAGNVHSRALADASTRAADAATRQSEIATGQSEKSERALVLAQRAWVGPTIARVVGTPEIGKPLKINIQYANSGREPALNFIYAADVL